MRPDLCIWIHKSPWLKPGPIVAMGLLNAWSCARQGVETHFFLRAGPVETDLAADLREYYGLDPLPNLHLHRVPPPRNRRRGHSRAVYQRAARFVRERARNDRRIAVFTRESGCLPTLARLRRPGRVAVFYESHDYFGPGRPDRQRLRQWRQRFVERIWAPRLDGLLAITHAQAELYRRWLRGKVEIRAHPLGCLPFPAPEVEARRKLRRLVYIGNLHAYKGRDTLIDLQPLLARHNLQLWVLGGSREDAERLAPDASNSLRVLPFQPPAQLHAILKSEVSVGLAPLTDTFYNRFLTCPVKALDYLAHGLPTLASDLPSLREVLAEGTATFLPEPSPAAIVEAAAALLDDPVRYAEVSRAARARAAALAWDGRGAALLDWAQVRLGNPQA